MPSEAAAGLSFGDVVLIRFPFTDQVGSKQRPAVIVSSAAYARQRPDLIMMAITSQLRASSAFGDVWIADWRPAGLLKPSAVKPVIATFEPGLIIRQLGVLGFDDQSALRATIAGLFG